jgi:hypothetical protein
MRTGWCFALFAATLAACNSEAGPAPEPPKAVAPLRGAAGDSDLRVMLSELASSKACAMIRGGFHGLRAPEHPNVVTGVLWIRECEITNIGSRVTFQIAGNGWSWIDETKSRGGGTFSVRQYVRFSIAATIRGQLDIAYDRDAHVASVWFTPDKNPDLKFKTIGDIEVDSEGVWSSAIGALGTAFATSPEDVALGQATSRGTRDFTARLGKGLAVTINLCTGLTRVHLGRPPKGEMGPANVGETLRVPVEVKPGGVMLIGPQLAGAGMTLKATASQGAAKVSLVCADDARTVATDFLQGRTISKVPTLGSVEVRTTARLEIKPTACPVVVVITPLGNSPARLAWERPMAEIARSSGGSIIHCKSQR